MAIHRLHERFTMEGMDCDMNMLSNYIARVAKDQPYVEQARIALVQKAKADGLSNFTVACIDDGCHLIYKLVKA